MRASGKRSTGKAEDTAFGWPRDFLGNRFVYAVISQRARGLSIGVNLNPEKHCNFDCVYCEVKRSLARKEQPVDLEVMEDELTRMLDCAAENKLRESPRFRTIPAELLRLKEIALSGDGEPTLSPNFDQAIETVLRVRSQRREFSKIVLITNTTGLFVPHVEMGWKQLTLEDEIWVKLDAGTQSYMDRVNRPNDISLQTIMANILQVGRLRPVVVQSLFSLVNNEEPSVEEIDAYIHRLQELVAGGVKISMVQIYSAHRPAQNPNCRHLPLVALSSIAKRVREQTRIKAEVF